jgi:hypothetical protein
MSYNPVQIGIQSPMFKKVAASIFDESKTLETIKSWGGEFKIIAA